MITKNCVLLLLLSLPVFGLSQGSLEEVDSQPSHTKSSISRAAHYAIIAESTNKILLQYAQLSPKRQKRLAFIVVPWTKLRRAALKWLIQNDPESAIRLSLSPAQRQGLPKYILRRLETRIHSVADLEQSISERFPIGDPQAITPAASDTLWAAQIGQTSFKAFIYGQRLGHQTKYDTPVHGIALDDLMAVDESPLYELDDFETIQYGFPSGTIVALSGELPIVFPDYFALAKLRQALLDQILLFGPRPLEIPSWTTGPKRLLVINADFSDNTGTLYSEGEIAGIVAEVDTFYGQNSRGLTSLSAIVLPTTLRLDGTSATYAAMGSRAYRAIGLDAVDRAREYDAALGGMGMYDPGDYDRYIVLTPQVFDNQTADGQLGGSRVVVSGDGLDFETLAHELGHTWGFIHSGFWQVLYGGDPIGRGTFNEYGDYWDMMGQSLAGETDVEPQRRHFNAYFKWRAAWLPGTSFVDASAGGTYRLSAHDFSTTGLRSIKIDAADGNTYWIGMRRRFETNLSMFVGVEVRRVTSAGLVQLLDMNPTAGTTIDHSMRQFGTFEDVPNGITIRVETVGVETAGYYANIVISRM